jgi:diguanylate cyclase (GGDEF)-like protein
MSWRKLGRSRAWRTVDGRPSLELFLQLGTRAVDVVIMYSKTRAHSKLLAPLLVLVLTVGAIAAVWLLVQRVDSSRRAQVQVALMGASLSDLKTAPFSADPNAGGAAAVGERAEISNDQQVIARGLTAHSQAGVPDSLLQSGRASLAEIEPVVAHVFRIASAKGGLAAGGLGILQLQKVLLVRVGALSGVLAKLSRSDAARAEHARTQAKLGAAAAMLLLLAAFAYFYFRSIAARGAVERLAREKEALLGESRLEARTDALTDLRNRRALVVDLERALAESPGPHELLLAIFDLDGFKQYNDTFGHAAGDALLERLSGRLAAATRHAGSAYRMGGDEFCMLARCAPDTAERLLDEAVTSLEDSGEGWHIGCSHGAVWIPSEATDASVALKLADKRMYANKASRSSPSRQLTDVLLQVIAEQNASLDEHVERVSRLAREIAEALGEPEHEVRQICTAAKLHDVGKTAIPAAILDKAGPLNAQEWIFMHRHPLIGERIVLAAPALASTAPLIRSSHERIDGHGYPDGLAGADIPLGSRIIAVCDAFDAMTSDRSYRTAMSADAALEELAAHAGSQFDGRVVATFDQLFASSRTGQLEAALQN